MDNFHTKLCIFQPEMLQTSKLIWPEWPGKAWPCQARLDKCDARHAAGAAPIRHRPQGGGRRRLGGAAKAGRHAHLEKKMSNVQLLDYHSNLGKC